MLHLIFNDLGARGVHQRDLRSSARSWFKHNLVTSRNRARNSGQPKQKWTREEEQALRLGVKSYGVGKWRLIQKDDACGPVLANRSNVDLKDKWRNLNMEARDQGYALIQPDDDPDFKRAASKRKRRKQRSGVAEPFSPHHSLQKPGDSFVQGPQEMDVDHGAMADSMEEADPVCSAHQAWPCPNPLNCASSDSQGSLNVSPGGKGSPLVDDMVVAAVISLQHPLGSGLDDICAWIEAHYPAVDRDNVNAVMNDMVKAGRLQRVTQHPCLVRMGGVVRQLEADNQAMQAMSAQDTSAHSKDDDVQLIDDKMVAEHALLAAQAIADAEEASRKASSLLEAARKLEDLHHNTLKGRQGM